MRIAFNHAVIAMFALMAGIVSAQEATFQTIQNRIFTPQCASCHVYGSSFAIQSDLLLTESDSYNQLVNIEPHNSAARADGLLRVGTEGLPSLYTSFLWEKIYAPDQEHFYEDHPLYGELMPLGMPYLTNGELEFIRAWIVAGAPQTGTVADTSLLADTSRFVPPPFAPLDPPAFGEQFHIGPFDVQTDYEREFLYWEPRDNTPERYINRVQVVMRPGSHHFIFYTFQPGTPGFIIPQPHVIRDIRDANGEYIIQNILAMQYHVFFAGTQWPRMDYHFPPGVALRLPAETGIDMNSHYVNYGDSVLQGEIYGNFHYAEPAEVEHVAEVLDLNNQDINLPPQQITTLTRTWTFNERMHIFQLFSHAHQHMLEFNAYIVGGPRDGELVYVAYDWQHPPILELDPPIVLEPGHGIRIEATYDNWEDHALHFGLLSEDEMMILFGYFYTDAANAETPPPVVASAELLGNFPNPFNPNTTISFALATASNVRLEIFNLQGQRVTLLADEFFPSGRHSVAWNGTTDSRSPAPSGLYLYRLTTPEFSSTNKMVMLK